MRGLPATVDQPPLIGGRGEARAARLTHRQLLDLRAQLDDPDGHAGTLLGQLAERLATSIKEWEHRGVLERLVGPRPSPGRVTLPNWLEMTSSLARREVDAAS